MIVIIVGTLNSTPLICGGLGASPGQVLADIQFAWPLFAAASLSLQQAVDQDAYWVVQKL